MRLISLSLWVMVATMNAFANGDAVQYVISRPGILCRSCEYIQAFDRLNIRCFKGNDDMSIPTFEINCLLPKTKGGGERVYVFGDKCSSHWECEAKGKSASSAIEEVPPEGLRLGRVGLALDDETGTAPHVVVSVVGDKDIEDRLVYKCNEEPWFRYCLGGQVSKRKSFCLFSIGVDSEVWCMNDAGSISNCYEVVNEVFDKVNVCYSVSTEGRGLLSGIKLRLRESTVKDMPDKRLLFYRALAMCTSLIKNAEYEFDECQNVFMAKGKFVSCYGDRWKLALRVENGTADAWLDLTL